MVDTGTIWRRVGYDQGMTDGILKGLRMARKRAFATDSVYRLVAQIDALIEQQESTGRERG